MVNLGFEPGKTHSDPLPAMDHEPKPSTRPIQAGSELKLAAGVNTGATPRVPRDDVYPPMLQEESETWMG